MSESKAVHLHFGVGAFGLGFVAPLMSQIKGLRVVLVNRSRTELHARLRTDLSYVVKEKPSDFPEHETVIDGLLFLDEDEPLMDVVVNASPLIVTTSLKDGLLPLLPKLKALFRVRSQSRGDTDPAFLVPCENVVADEFTQAWSTVDEVVYVPSVVDRVCNVPTTTIDGRVCVEVERYASWILERPENHPALEELLRPLRFGHIAHFVDEIDHYRRRKLWLVNGVHAACALFALRANRLMLHRFLQTDFGDHMLRQVQLEICHALLETVPDQHEDFSNEVLGQFNAEIRRRFKETPDTSTRVLARFNGPQLEAFFRSLKPKLVDPRRNAHAGRYRCSAANSQPSCVGVSRTRRARNLRLVLSAPHRSLFLAI